jgi:hypothetical protein
MITEVKSGNGTLSPQQLEKLAEAARTGGIYIVNEAAAEKLEVRPHVTFGKQGIMPQVFVVGGNQDAIAKQLRKVGLEVIPEKPRRGQPPRLRVLRPM